MSPRRQKSGKVSRFVEHLVVVLTAAAVASVATAAAWHMRSNDLNTNLMLIGIYGAWAGVSFLVWWVLTHPAPPNSRNNQRDEVTWYGS